jgi:hypothetical protein
MNDTSTPVKNRKTRYDLNFKRSAVELCGLPQLSFGQF